MNNLIFKGAYSTWDYDETHVPHPRPPYVTPLPDRIPDQPEPAGIIL